MRGHSNKVTVGLVTFLLRKKQFINLWDHFCCGGTLMTVMASWGKWNENQCNKWYICIWRAINQLRWKVALIAHRYKNAKIKSFQDVFFYYIKTIGILFWFWSYKLLMSVLYKVIMIIENENQIGGTPNYSLKSIALEHRQHLLRTGKESKKERNLLIVILKHLNKITLICIKHKNLYEWIKYIVLN